MFHVSFQVLSVFIIFFIISFHSFCLLVFKEKSKDTKHEYTYFDKSLITMKKFSFLKRFTLKHLFKNITFFFSVKENSMLFLVDSKHTFLLNTC